MLSAINEIIKLIPIPENPKETGDSVSWENIEEQCKTALPDDYKWFINTYGSGQIGGFVNVFNPFSANKYINLISQMKVILDIERELKENDNDHERPYPLFPDEGGLFPFAGTDNGDVFFWKTTGNPSKWTVILADLRSPYYNEYDTTFSGTLEKLMKEEMNSRIIPKGFIDKTNLFTSFK